LREARTRNRTRQEAIVVVEKLPWCCYCHHKTASAMGMKNQSLSISTSVLSVIIVISQLAALVSPIESLQNDSTTTNFAREIEPIDDDAGGSGLVFTVPSSIRPNDDPENKIDIVQKARKNEISAEMITNKTRAMVSCETGEILVKINFTEPFRGVAYADYDKSSPCKFFGEGANYYEMRLPLKGCGTKQEAPRLFVNNIVLRFHRSLELEEDEVKTIVCRYPPPQAPAPPPPPGLPAKVIQAPPEPAKLTQYEPFVLIAGLLFFALLLAGVGTTSYVTRKQTIKPINTPLPIIAQTEYDTYVDNQSIKTIEDLTTSQKIVPLPKLSTHIVDDVFITNIHEIDTIEDLVHHKRVVPKPHLEQRRIEDTYITNQDEIECEETLQQHRLERQRQLGHRTEDDCYITNQDERQEDELLTHHKMLVKEPKLEVRTIEDTFITNVDEIVEQVDTTYLKNLDDRRQQQQQHFEEYESRLDSLRRSS
jgi:hypothetical protein